jgi:DNA polymerase-3 subunit epsilon
LSELCNPATDRILESRFERLVFIDLETTGVNAATDRITEIGLIEVCAGAAQRWSSLVNPGIAIPPFIQELTGIDDIMVRDAPPFSVLQDELLKRLSGSLFIAHNARFDHGFLRNAFAEHGHQLQCDVLCTVKLSRKLYPDERKHNLDTLIMRHQLQVGDRHRALADADLLWQLWRKLQVEIPTEQFEQAIRAQLPQYLMTVQPANI